VRAEIWILSRLGGWLEKEKWQKFVSCAIIRPMPERAVFERRENELAERVNGRSF